MTIKKLRWKTQATQLPNKVQELQTLRQQIIIDPSIYTLQCIQVLVLEVWEAKRLQASVWRTRSCVCWLTRRGSLSILLCATLRQACLWYSTPYPMRGWARGWVSMWDECWLSEWSDTILPISVHLRCVCPSQWASSSNHSKLVNPPCPNLR